MFSYLYFILINLVIYFLLEVCHLTTKRIMCSFYQFSYRMSSNLLNINTINNNAKLIDSEYKSLCIINIFFYIC